MVDVKSHQHGYRVPSTGNQTAIRALLRFRCIDMHNLRIILLGKINDIVFVDADWAEFIRLADSIIFKIPVVDEALERSLRHGGDAILMRSISRREDIGFELRCRRYSKN